MTTRSLTQTLLDEGLVTKDQIHEATQRQVVYGGSLDTVLLEDGVLTEAQALQALGTTYDLPSAGAKDINIIGPHIPRLFPLLFAETYHLVPYSLDNQNFGVLLNGPPDEQLFDRIRDRLQLNLVPIITTEVRLHYAMGRLYGTEILPRFRALLAKLDANTAAPPPKAEPAAKKEHVLSWGLSSGKIAAPRGGTKSGGGLDLRSVLARLDAATDRDAIVEVVLGAALSIFELAAFFLVQGNQLNGFRSTDLEKTRRVARMSLPLDAPSAFQTVVSTGGHYLGPLPESPVHAAFLAELERASPRTTLVVALKVSDRMAAVLYADNGPRGIPSKRVADILVVAQRAGLAFQSLIQRRKQVTREILTTPLHQPAKGSTALGEVETREEAKPIAQPLPAVEPTPRPLSAPHPAAPVAPLSEHEQEIELEVESADDEDDGYVPFADISDDPDESVDDWEDVLVETVAAEEAKKKSRFAARHKDAEVVTWQEVVAEARRAVDTAPPKRAESVEVAGTVLDERELLMDGLEARDPEARRAAVERLVTLGIAADDLLRDRFPGPIDFDPLDPTAAVPPFARCSGITELVAARGVDAAAVVLPHLEGADAQKRFFAIYYLMTVQHPEGISALSRRLYDSEPRNRYLAADALRTYAHDPRFRQVVQSLREQLKVPVLATQVSTVQVLGQLREPAAVPSLIPLVVASQAELSQSAMSALAVVCGQALGQDVAAWAKWWQGHYNKPRATWLLESLRLPSPAMQQLAHNELQILSGRAMHFDANGDEAAKAAVVAQWDAWWQDVSTLSARPQGNRNESANA